MNHVLKTTLIVIVVLFAIVAHQVTQAAPTRTPVPTRTPIPTKTIAPTSTPKPNVPGNITNIPIVKGSLGTVAFVGEDGAINLVDMDGKNLRAILPAKSALSDGVLQWSPDGKQLAFTSTDSSLSVVDADGSNQRILSGSHSSAFWSADGKELFVAVSLSLTAINVETGSTRDLSMPTSTDKIDNIFVSPDGTSAVFAVSLEANKPSLIVNLVTGAETPLIGQGTDFVWSPDSKHIAYNLVAAKAQSGVYDIETKTFTPIYVYDPYLQNPGPADTRFAWSPDGTQVMYKVVGDAFVPTYYVINTNGTNPRRLPLGTVIVSRGQYHDSLPFAWRPVPAAVLTSATPVLQSP